MSTTQQPRRRRSVSYNPISQPTNRRLPKELAATIPLAAQYEELMRFEHKIDATITRKRYDMQDALNRPLKMKRILRVWCSNTASDQAWQASGNGTDENNFDFENGSIPSWTLRIEGLLLPNEYIAPEDDINVQFTDLIRSVLIEEDKGFDNLYSEGPILDYQKPTSARSTSPPSLPGLEIKRKGDSDINLKISITLENSPERYKLQPKLASLLDLPEATRQEIMTGLWYYVQASKLQDPEDRRLVHADAALRDIFNLDRLFFPDLPKLINRQLLPLDPIVLLYTVRVNNHTTPASQYHDIEVHVDSPIRSKLHASLQRLSHPSPILTSLDHTLSSIVADIETAVSKKEFFESYVRDPSAFIEAWMASQNEDMEIMMGDVKKVSGERARRAEFYEESKDWLKESLFHYLSEPRAV